MQTNGGGSPLGIVKGHVMASSRPEQDWMESAPTGGIEGAQGLGTLLMCPFFVPDHALHGLLIAGSGSRPTISAMVSGSRWRQVSLTILVPT